MPGCRHRAFVDIHHIDRRADGGGHDPERLVVLCGAHHAAEHEGRLVVAGCASRGFTFAHGDGSPYGSGLHGSGLHGSGLYGSGGHPERALAFAQVFSALKKLGFREREARAALDAARVELDGPHVGASSDAPSVELLLRAALRAMPEGGRGSEGGPGSKPGGGRGRGAGVREALPPYRVCVRLAG